MRHIRDGREMAEEDAAVETTKWSPSGLFNARTMVPRFIERFDCFGSLLRWAGGCAGRGCAGAFGGGARSLRLWQPVSLALPSRPSWRVHE
jgi:hypothetical protein